MTPDKHDFRSQEKFIEKYSSDFFSTCANFFLLKPEISSVTVIPSLFGTGSSYFLDNTKKSRKLFVTLRVDSNYRFVFKSVLSAIIYSEGKFKDESLVDWYIRKGISDFLFNHTRFKELLEAEEEIKVLGFVKGYKADLFIDSARYYAKLGYPIQSCFSYDDRSIYYNGRVVIGLQDKEIILLKKMIDFRSQIVSFDEIGDIFWGINDEHYSLAALAKIVERLRNKLELNGIPDSYIRTIRKRGYLLYD